MARLMSAFMSLFIDIFKAQCRRNCFQFSQNTFLWLNQFLPCNSQEELAAQHRGGTQKNISAQQQEECLRVVQSSSLHSCQQV